MTAAVSRAGLGLPRVIWPKWWTGAHPLPQSNYTVDCALYPKILHGDTPPPALKDMVSLHFTRPRPTTATYWLTVD